MQPDPQSDNSNWAFRVESEGPEPSVSNVGQPTSAASVEPIVWTGSEFIAHQRTAGWYAALFGVIGVVAAVIFVISRDILSIGFIVVMGVLFAIIASRKPRQLQYIIDESGISIGNRQHRFNDFKSFSLQRSGAIGYINLLPLKRLMPEISIFYTPEDEQRIFDALSSRIPHEEHKESYIDKLTRMIRF